MRLKGNWRITVFGAVLLLATRVIAEAEIAGGNYWEDSVSYSEVQDGVERQLLVVVNDDATWNQMVALLPSLTGPLPTFDSTTDTAIIFTTKANTCEFMPSVDFVSHEVSYRYPFTEGMLVHVLEKSEDALDASVCDAAAYVAHVVVIAKMDLPVGLEISKDVW